MNKHFTTLLLILILCGSIATYKAFLYFKGVNQDISQTEDRLMSAQSEILARITRLSEQTPQLKNLLSKIGELDSNATFSHEQIRATATTIEILRRLKSHSSEATEEASTEREFSKILVEIEKWRELHAQLSHQRKNNNLAEK